jgi:hypothetical protein
MIRARRGRAGGRGVERRLCWSLWPSWCSRSPTASTTRRTPSRRWSRPRRPEAPALARRSSWPRSATCSGRAGVGLAGIEVILGVRRLWPGIPGVMVGVGVGVGIAAVAAFDPPIVGLRLSGPCPGACRRSRSPMCDWPTCRCCSAARWASPWWRWPTPRCCRNRWPPSGERWWISNQELLALGAANLAVGLFHGFPFSASASRTPVAISAGARTQATRWWARRRSSFSCWSLQARCGTFPADSRRRRDHCGDRTGRRTSGAAAVPGPTPGVLLWLAAFLGVALLGVLVGILVAILLSLG